MIGTFVENADACSMTATVPWGKVGKAPDWFVARSDNAAPTPAHEVVGSIVALDTALATDVPAVAALHAGAAVAAAETAAMADADIATMAAAGTDAKSATLTAVAVVVDLSVQKLEQGSAVSVAVTAEAMKLAAAVAADPSDHAGYVV